jgi:hypothetical protein
MKKLLPEQLPKLLQEESSDSVKKLDAPESIEDSNKVKAVNRTEEAKV